MDNIADKIQSILTDEDSLKQIQALYEALSGGSKGNSETVQEQEKTQNQTQTQDQTQDQEQNDDSCTQENNEEGNIPDFDFSTIFKLQGLFNGDGQEDKNTALLLALKPHLSEEKREKADKAIKILHLLNAAAILKESGLLNDML